MPSIVSDECIGFFDPQEEIWKGESGRLFNIKDISDSDHISVFKGIK